MEHPLKNPNSRYYEIIDGIESIDVMEGVMKGSELKGWCKGNILKYQLRLGKKDSVESDIAKIATYKAYFEYLTKHEVTT